AGAQAPAESNRHGIREFTKPARSASKVETTFLAGASRFYRPVVMSAELAALQARALAELNAAADEAALRAWNTKYFGKQGEMLLALKKVGSVPPDQRRAYGQQANQVKESLLNAYENAVARAKSRALERSLASESLDETLPGRPIPRGRLHVATKVLRDIYAIFSDLGFQTYRSREVEDDRTNFELL